MVETLLRIANLTKRFGSLAASDGLSLDVLSGELHAVIGPNGAGKTTLISQLFGEIVPDDGAIWFAGRDISALTTAERVHIGLARSFQITQLLLDYTALDNVALATQAHRGHSFRFWANARRDRALREQALRTLARVGLERRADTAVSEMSHGEQKLLELASALATQPRLLLLDEPMAGLGATECAATVELLRGLKTETTILLVEHDMDVVFALADRISVLVNGRCVITGTADDVRNDATAAHGVSGEGDLYAAGRRAASELRARPGAVRRPPRRRVGGVGDAARPQRHGQDHDDTARRGCCRGDPARSNSSARRSAIWTPESNRPPGCRPRA